MFAQYLGLQSNPFEAIDNSDAAYFHKSFQNIYDALETLIKSDSGMVFLTGISGIGKTTLTRRIIEDLKKQGQAIESLDARAIDPELIVPEETDSKQLPTLNTFSGDKSIVYIDHIECLSIQELYKLLASYLTPDAEQNSTLLILAGTIEYFKHLNDSVPPACFNDLTRHYLYFKSIQQDEISAYIDSRLAITGKHCADFYSPDVVSAIYALTKGVPGAINNLCAATLILSNVNEQQIISCETVDEAAGFCTLPQHHPDEKIPEIEQKINPESADPEKHSAPVNTVLVPKNQHKILAKSLFEPKYAALFLFLGCGLGIGLNLLYFQYQKPSQTLALQQPQAKVLDLTTSKSPWSMTKSLKHIAVDNPDDIADKTSLAAKNSEVNMINNLPASASGLPSAKVSDTIVIESDTDQIVELLELANKQRNSFQLAFPAGNNALETYQKILQLDATNGLALTGIQTIKLRYLSRASKAELIGDPVSALVNYEKALLTAKDDINIRFKIDMIKAKLKHER